MALGLAANVEIKPAAGFDRETGRVTAQAVQAFVQCHAAACVGMPFLLSSFSCVALEAARIAAPALPRALLVEEIPADWRNRLLNLECGALHCAVDDLVPAQATEVVGAGIPLACYTVNRPDEARELFALGVSAVFSDRLDLFDPSGEAWPTSLQA